MSTLEERAQADNDDSDRFEFAGTQRDTLTSFIKTSGALVKMTAERDEALAMLGRVRALLGDHDGPLWAVRGVREADIRAALEPRCTCSGITSQHGVDQNFGPDKVWRCDECDRIWEPTDLPKGKP